MWQVALASVLVVLIFTSCIPDTGDVGFSISGVVSDSMTSVPIESALVYMGDTTGDFAVATDSTGAYVWAGFGYGPTKVSVKKLGYSTGVRIFKSWVGDKKGADFKLAPE